jgi:cell division protein FtsB
VDGSRLVVRVHNPRRWRIAIALSVALVLLLGFGVFELGRRAGGYFSLEAGRERSAMEAELARLSAENQSLKEEVARLQTTLDVDVEAQRRLRESLQATEAEVAELNEDLAFYRRIMSPPDGKGGLRVQAFEVAREGEGDRYRLKLVLVQARQQERKAQGQVSVQLEGSRAGEVETLELADLAAEPPSFDFLYFQDIVLEVTLPEDFAAETAQVVLTPRGKGATPVTASFPWSPEG